MAVQRMTPVTKLNKGTSRDQWGKLNFFGYKSPDGVVRSRLTPIGDGKAELEVKHFDQSQISHYRKTLRWEEADNIGSSIIDLDDAATGKKSQDMIDEVNCLIEVHNDIFDEWNGKQIIGQNYNGDWDTDPSTVTGGYTTFTEDGVMSTFLYTGTGRGYSGRAGVDLTKTKLHTDDMARTAAQELISEHLSMFEATAMFLAAAQAALDNGERMEVPESYKNEGLIEWRKAQRIAERINELTPEPVEEPAEAIV